MTLYYPVASEWTPQIGGHAELFLAVVGQKEMGDDRTPTTAICRPKLEEAVKFVAHIDELSCGLWAIKYHMLKRRPLKYAVLLVELSPAFLVRVGVIQGVNEPRVLDKRHVRTALKVQLGCPECARGLVRYSLERWKPDTPREWRYPP